MEGQTDSFEKSEHAHRYIEGSILSLKKVAELDIDKRGRSAELGI